MQYTVSFLFNRNLSEVLLVQKETTEYIGRFNGVGGELESGEGEAHGAFREIKEETGVGQVDHFTHVATTMLGHDCKTGKDDLTTLFFYAGIIDPEQVVPPPEAKEMLQWCDTGWVCATPVDDPIFAGDGDVQYLINLSMKMLRGFIVEAE